MYVLISIPNSFICILFKLCPLFLAFKLIMLIHRLQNCKSDLNKREHFVFCKHESALRAQLKVLLTLVSFHQTTSVLLLHRTD